MVAKFSSPPFKLIGIAMLAWGLSFWLSSDRMVDPTMQAWGFGCDAQTYWDLSGNLLQGKGFVDSPGMGHAFSGYLNRSDAPNVVRLPSYPFALMLFRWLWNSIETAYLLNLVCFLMIIFYGYGLVKSLDHNLFVGSLYILALAFSPLYLVYLQGVQSDLFSGAMTVGFVYHFYRLPAAASPSWYHPVFAVIFGGASILSRPNLIFFILPLMVVEGMASILRKRSIRRLGIIGGMICLSAAGWCLRNQAVSGHFALSDQLGNNLFLNYVYYQVSAGSEFYPWRDRARTEWMQESIEKGFSPAYAEFELDKRLRQEVIRYAEQNPRVLIIAAIRSILGLFVGSHFEIADITAAKFFQLPMADNQVVPSPAMRPYLVAMRFLSRASRYGLLVGFVLSPLMFWMRRSIEERLVFLWISCVLFVAATGLVINSGDRLLLPVYPFLLLLFVWALFIMFKQKANHSSSQA